MDVIQSEWELNVFTPCMVHAMESHSHERQIHLKVAMQSGACSAQVRLSLTHCGRALAVCTLCIGIDHNDASHVHGPCYQADWLPCNHKAML